MVIKGIMPDYSKGKVYKLEVLHDPSAKVYVGSTVEILAKRLSHHRSHYKQWKEGKRNFYTAFDLFNKYDATDIKITLIENIVCTDRQELIACERKWILSLDCVNKCQPGRPRKEYQKEYRENNRDKLKEYREDNRDKLKEQKKEYYEKNKDAIKEKHSEYLREYYRNNREKYKEQGRNYRKGHKEQIRKYREEHRDIINQHARERYHEKKILMTTQ